ncbi:hypothetical protein E1B28_011387 [Marasmius oreades]|uniref:Uncharacterized protein n=1 Tax=Marasmius oreades TaxID=181124 RepID=A0A9P7UPX2_9AGAR|nr:uncharacterized protein E1B28_011387 [Marasmius oreades]KAG7089733.1 hypothetical protein E1B28_011387 [Marasmius oreades]
MNHTSQTRYPTRTWDNPSRISNLNPQNEQERGVPNFLEATSDLSLGYRLPKLIEAKQKRWIRTLKDGTIISSILTVVSGQLLIFYRSSFSSLNQDRSLAIAFLSNLSFIFNLISTFISIVLANKLGRLPDVAARRDAIAPQDGYVSASGGSLKLYGLKTSWYLMAFYWAICFSSGIGCLLAQVMVYVWMDEALPVKIVATCLVVLALPLSFALFAN